MDSASWLLVLCASMFMGAFGSGYIPLTFSMSESRLRLVTIFGAGLLVGTALIVIIPEGIAMHYEAQAKRLAELEASHAHAHGRMLLHDHAAEASLGAVAVAEGAETTAAEAAHSHGHGDHWQIGAALALGFAFQLVVDRISGGMHGHAHGVSVSSSEGGSGASSGSAGSSSPGGPSSELSHASAKSKSAMAGMVVHAAVDGVALGAAVREGDSALGLLVFVAIMLHKAPSSFGLASYLLHHGISVEGVKRRLLIFSSAAPLGALLTYIVLSINLFSYRQEMLALCLLFSGGTFLYVATAHVLPEVQLGTHGAEEEDEEEGGRGHHGHSHGHSGAPRTPPRMKWSEVWLLVSGVLLPLVLNMQHGH